MDSEICMWKTGIMTTSDYKKLFLNYSLSLLIISYPEHFFLRLQKFQKSESMSWTPLLQDFHFKLQLIKKKKLLKHCKNIYLII